MYRENSNIVDTNTINMARQRLKYVILGFISGFLVKMTYQPIFGSSPRITESQANTTKPPFKVVYKTKNTLMGTLQNNDFSNNKTIGNIAGNVTESMGDLYSPGNSKLANKLFLNVRVLCWVMTHPTTVENKATAVKKTWGRRCNKLLFMSDKDYDKLPAIGMNTSAGRGHLTAKSVRAFDYVYKHHFQDADWFLKADDDTFMIMENLRYMMSAYSPSDPIFFGHSFHQPGTGMHYFSGGAGYILSKEALRRFGMRQTDFPNAACAEDGVNEDIKIAECLLQLHVLPQESFDIYNRTRFHCESPAVVMVGLPWGFRIYDRFRGKYHKGVNSISQFAVSFHKVTPEMMHFLDYMLYTLRPYGILNMPPLVDINPSLNIKQRKTEKHISGKKKTP